MFTKNKNPKVSYISRLLVLPLAAIIFFAFTLKVTPLKSAVGYSGKTITVVIDAGHGGDDNGAVSASGLKEKDIDLAIAKKIAELNSNDHIKILLSRNDDVSMNVKDRVEFARANHSDLFISIHTNAADKDNTSENGFSVIIDKNNSEKNKLLASAIINELQKIYTTESTIGVRTNGVWVLDNNVCPAALIECGYITSPADEAFITVISNQEKIARNILDGIEKYAEQNAGQPTITQVESDSIPRMYYKNKKVTGLEVRPKLNNILVSYNDGTKEIITKEESDKRGFILPPPPPPSPRVISTNTGFLNQSPNPIYIVDGKEEKNALKNISPNSIESISVLKGETAVSKYGEKGKNGVVIITTKKANKDGALDEKPAPPPHATDVTFSLNKDKVNITYNDGHVETISKEEAKNQGLLNRVIITSPDTIPNKVFTKVEHEAEFPGGQDAWVKYIVGKVQASIDSFTDKDYGTCVVKFIVNTDGTVSNIEATTMKDTHFAQIAMNAIRTGPTWIPATQNGHTVAAYRLQPVTLTNPEKK